MRSESRPIWDAYRQAIDVHDRKSDPPPDWWPQFAADAEAFVERMLAERLRKFDTGDLWVTGLHLRITSSWEVQVEPGGPSEVADPAVTKKERPTGQAIAARAVAKRGELKAAGREHGRDVMVPLAAKRFGVKQDVVRLAWRLRPSTTGNKPDRL